MLLIDIILYEFLVKLVWSALPNVCLLKKLKSNALPNVLMSADQWFWVTRIDTIFGIVDDIVPDDFVLLWSIY